jgi:hypothetical protein
LDWTEHLIINNKCHNDNDAAAGTDTLAVRACVCVLADGGDEGGSSYGTCVVFIGGGRSWASDYALHKTWNDAVDKT